MSLKWEPVLTIPPLRCNKVARLGPLRLRVWFDESAGFYRYNVTVDPDIWGHELTEEKATRSIIERVRAVVRAQREAAEKKSDERPLRV